MSKMSEFLRPTVYRAIQEYARLAGIVKPQIHVTPGSRNGDSYSGEVYRVHVRPDGWSERDADAEPAALRSDPHFNQLSSSSQQHIDQAAITTTTTTTNSLHFIAKLPPKIASRRKEYRSAAHFAREQFVYEQVLPAFESFQAGSLLDGDVRFDNYPRMVGASSADEDEYVVLNDLAKCGFRNADKTVALSFERCILVLTNLARFHAVSFALKDQEPEKIDPLTAKLPEIMFTSFEAEMDTFLRRNVGYALSTLDEAKDADVVARVKGFGETISDAMVAACAERADAVVLHGDCWISNLMFRQNPNAKEEVQFLDWQVARYGSVAIDLSYFLCCCTDATVRQRWPDLLHVYHSALVDRICTLGSPGDRLFSMQRLQWHMQKYAKFGFGMAIMSLHATCYPANQMADVKTSLDSVDMNGLDQLCKPMVSYPPYVQRMSDLCRDMVRLDYI